MEKESQKRSSGALRGVRVLDLSRVLAGPWATQLLGDYGAKIIKVERPVDGDDTRAWGPPWLPADVPSSRTDAAYFLATNRNKRSITVNIAHPEGAKIVRELAANSDVLVENFKVGTLSRFGLGYAELAAVNPGLIYCSVSAYGQSGSRAGLPGYDAMIQASGGLMSITGAPDEEGGSPQKVGVAIADIMTGMYASSAILAALISRTETGNGQWLDVPLYDSQVAWLANQNMNYLVSGVTPGRQGTGHPNLVPYQTFATADGYLTLSVGNDRQYRDCMRCLELDELGEDTRFLTNGDRVENRLVLVPLIAQRLKSQSTEFWLEVFIENGVPAGPVNSIDEVLSGDYAKERELVKTFRGKEQEDIPTVANPVDFSETPVEYRYPPPQLGEHTEEVLLQELEYSIDKINALYRCGAI